MAVIYRCVAAGFEVHTDRDRDGGVAQVRCMRLEMRLARVVCGLCVFVYLLIRDGLYMLGSFSFAIQ